MSFSNEFFQGIKILMNAAAKFAGDEVRSISNLVENELVDHINSLALENKQNTQENVIENTDQKNNVKEEK